MQQIVTNKKEPTTKQKGLIEKLYNVYKAFKGRDIGLKAEHGGDLNTFIGSQKASPSQDRFNREFYEPCERRNLIAQINTLLADHPVLESALLIFSGGAVGAGFNSQVVEAGTKPNITKAQDIIDKIKKRCKLELFLPQIAFQLCTFGDVFVQISLDKKGKEINGIRVMPVGSMERLTDDKEEWIDPEKAFLQRDAIDLQLIIYLGLGQVIHARHLHVPGQRYGKSRIFSTRGIAKDAIDAIRSLLPRRLANQPFRWYNLLDSGDEPLTEAQWSDFHNNTSRRVAIEQGRGLSPYDDVYTNKVQLEVVSGDPNLGTMADIEMLLDASLSSTGVSRQILGFGTNVNRDVLDEQRDQLYAQQQQFAKEITEQILHPLYEIAFLLADMDPDIIKVQTEYYQQFTDRQMEARMSNARKDFIAGGISRKTYVKTISAYYLINDPDQEIKEIKKDRDEATSEKEMLAAKQANNRQEQVPTAAPSTDKGLKTASENGKTDLLNKPTNKKSKIDPFGRKSENKSTTKETKVNGKTVSKTTKTSTTDSLIDDIDIAIDIMEDTDHIDSNEYI
jgi:hypothetical protein